MAKAVADVHHPPENAAGYVTSDRAVIGFSQLHDSGEKRNCIPKAATERTDNIKELAEYVLWTVRLNLGKKIDSNPLAVSFSRELPSFRKSRMYRR